MFSQFGVVDGSVIKAYPKPAATHPAFSGANKMSVVVLDQAEKDYVFGMYDTDTFDDLSAMYSNQTGVPQNNFSFVVDHQVFGMGNESYLKEVRFEEYDGCEQS